MMTSIHQMSSAPTPVPPRSTNGTRLNDPTGFSGVEMDIDQRPAPVRGFSFGRGPQKGDSRIVVIIFGPGQEKIVSVFADVLGKQHRLCPGFQSITAADHDAVIGINADEAKADIASRSRELIVAINAHCVNLGMPPDPFLSAEADYEFLYTEAPFYHRDLTRFISFTLGQINHHEALMAKPRTAFISTTFPDVHAALPNIDILTVGSDAIEIRVDLLKEPLADGSYARIPSLSYVGEQVMLLRQRTELPIMFSTRCVNEGGRFPMDNPEIHHEYLSRAIQWGVEYVDVEVWLPEDIRRDLYEKRGSSRIISAYHDFTGNLRWSSPEAQAIFDKSRKYSDLIRMMKSVSSHNENFELEYFRYKIDTEYPDAPPLTAINMGEIGQLSRTLNKVFTPSTHPLLPIIAAPGQMSAAEINAALSLMGQLPKKSIYGITTPAARIATPQAPFYEKCFNELGLPHHFAVVERQNKGAADIEAWCNQKNFGGAYLSPPTSLPNLMTNSSFFSKLSNGTGPTLTEAARLIGVIDTIVVQSVPSPNPESAPPSGPSSPSRHNESSYNPLQQSSSGLPSTASLVFDNASWRGILSTLTRDLAPSAYFGRTAVVLASSSDDAASVVYALKQLHIGKVYTVGFKTPLALSRGIIVEPFNSLESLQRARTMGDEAGPFVIVSALASDKSNIVGMLIRIFAGSKGTGSNSRKVFLDLADGPRKSDLGLVAEQSGFAAYGVADTSAFTTVETLRLLVGQNVPYSFVRLASGRGQF